MTKSKPRQHTSHRAGLPWTFRGLQMDLARHMETVPYICRHADDAARDGFNTLVLYLEGRVRTDTFPHRRPGDSYSLDDMARVVTHAGKIGLDVIPVVATLGHCEQFLACEALQPLSETRAGRGRFGATRGGGSVICPSLDATYAFIERYLGELAQVFGGPNLHVGLDEAWDLGSCDRCRARWETDGLGALFMTHVQRMHAILKRLGRRLWMWDDFLELFPDQVSALPRDVVLCHWGYDETIEPEGIQAHFVNRRRRNWLALYERLGFDAVVCPWDRCPRNIEALTDYARRHRVLGGLLTEWEGTPRYWPGQRAVSAFTGALWRGDPYAPEKAWGVAMRRTLPGASPALQSGARDWLRAGGTPAPVNLAALPGERLARPEAARDALATLLRDLIDRETASLSPAARPLAGQISWDVERARLLTELRVLSPAILHPRRPAGDEPGLSKRLRAWHRDYRALMRRVPATFASRAGETHADDQRILSAWRSLPERLQPLEKALDRNPTRTDWLLILRLYLQDFYGAPRLRISMRSKHRECKVLEGGYKPATLIGNTTGGHYDIRIPFVSATRPDTIELSAWGYGGQGVAFLELQNPKDTLMPVAIGKISGPISQPASLLTDDASVTMLGTTDIMAQVHHPQLAGQRATMEIRLGIVAW